jgi:hypothetical protein
MHYFSLDTPLLVTHLSPSLTGDGDWRLVIGANLLTSSVLPISSSQSPIVSQTLMIEEAGGLRDRSDTRA